MVEAEKLFFTERGVIMKKAVILSMAVTLMLAFTGCGQSVEAPQENTEAAETAASEEAVTVETEETTASEETEELEKAEQSAKSEGVMTYDEYMAAELESEVVIETYVQAKQSWWEDKATLYTQDEDGAYFIYNMACSEEDYEKLVPGTKIKATGYKTEWSGEVEIAEGASFEIEEGNYIAPALDVTELLGTDELIEHQNKFVSFKGMTVEPAGQDADGNDVAYLYNWDGSGEDGSDLYFNVSLNDETYTFTVESYLCDNTTEVYKAVTNLQIGDVVDMEGFLYWYEGVNPHITSVTVAQ